MLDIKLLKSLKKGLANYLPIFYRNILTPTTILIGILVIVLIYLGQRNDAYFLASTITINSMIGIIQEIRASLALNRLELFQKQKVRREVGNKTVEIDPEDIFVGDFLVIKNGDQIPADGIIQTAQNCQVDEALLTGESLPIDKNTGDKVYAGSLVIAGKATFRVNATGEETQLSNISKQLSAYQQKSTPLQRDIYQLIKWLTYLSIIVSIFIFIDKFEGRASLKDIMNMIVSGALSLVPEGLLLASTLLFSYGAIQMANSGVLVQYLAAIEGFGRLKFLCTDKTGTLTEPQPLVEKILPLPGHETEDTRQLIWNFCQADPTPNPTQQAIMQHIALSKDIDLQKVFPTKDFLPFNSQNKYSAVAFAEHTIILGAPEMIIPKLSPPKEMNPKYWPTSDLLGDAEDYANQGLRVLLVADFGELKNRKIEELIQLPTAQAIAFILLSNPLRQGVQDSIFYLQANGVNLKVISGDNPSTVRYIAAEAGILGSDQIITGDQLALLSPKDWDKEVLRKSIFARILPDQKKRIISTLKKKGFTGMVGDGVNDALALKNADLGVAMAEGSQASRQVADVVLLNNNFTTFPQGMRLGSQIILGLEMVTCLFLNRIVLSLILIFGGILFDLKYPFTAPQLFLLNIFVIGLPSLLWSLVPPKINHRLSSEHFFRRVLRFAIPNGLITGLAIGSAFASVGLTSLSEARTASLLVAFALGIYTFWLIPNSLHATVTRQLRSWQFGYFIFSLLILGILLTQNIFYRLLYIQPLTLINWLFTLLAIVIAGIVQNIIQRERKATLQR